LRELQRASILGDGTDGETPLFRADIDRALPACATKGRLRVSRRNRSNPDELLGPAGIGQRDE
jgi:hypothetical protein